MSVSISSDLLDLLNSAVHGRISEYSIETKAFDGKGEGFVGDILYVNLVEKETKEKQFLVVKQQKSYNGKPFEFTAPLFDNEIHFYTTIWPTLHKFYQEKTGKELSIVPHCLATSTTGFKRLVLENLLSKDFVLHDKTKPLNKEHFSLIFNTYGIYHGISMALKEQNIEEYDRLLEPLQPLWRSAYDNESFAGKILMLLSHICQEIFDEETEKSVIERLQVYEQEGPKIINECLRKGGGDGILLHGDCWSNNNMFRYKDNGELKDIKLLDFQIVFSGSPVFDLSYSFYSGGSGETFKELDDYLKIYFTSFANTLKEFGLQADKLYSFSTLKDEWKKYSKFGYAMALMLWTVKLADKDAINEFSDYKPGPEEEVKPLKIADNMKDVYRQRMRELILHMYKNDFM